MDDEPWARKRIASLLKAEKDIAIAGECADGESAVSAIHSASPDVVFLDVQMPGMNGFEVLEAVGAERWPRIVFVTAYDKYAVQAFEIHAVDYLLKPFDEKRFQTALRRVRSELETATGDERQRIAKLIRSLSGGPQYLRRLGVKSGGRVAFVKTADVDWLEATGNYIALHVGGESHLIRETMNGMEGKLDPNQFVRVHRSTIVNLDRVKEVQPWFGGEQTLLLKDGTQLTVGRAFRHRLRHLMENTPGP